MKITAGATRTVILTKRLAIKLPRVYRKNRQWEWTQFLHGLLANLQERYWSNYHTRTALCPVWFADPVGLLVVMPRCRPLERRICPVEVLWFQEYERVPCDWAQENWGWHNGRVVLIDYGS